MKVWLLLCLFAAGGAVFAQTTPAAPPAAGAAPAENFLLQAARSVGVKQCLPAVSRLASLAVAGSRAHDVLVDWDRSQPDAGPFFSLVGVNFQGQSIAATITAIPQANDTCTVAAERISVAPYTCESIASVELKGYAVTRLLPTFTVYTQANDPGASVSLIDSPPGCLVIRRHVQYRWRDPTQPVTR
jgi:hypothetical protein